MYPAGDLSEIEERKRHVRERIRHRRARLAGDARLLARPLALADRALELWRRTSPWIRYVVLPAGFLARRTMMRRPPATPRWLRWAPVVLRTVRMFREVAAARRSPVDGP